MTIRDLIDQIELLGNVRVQETTDNGIYLHYCGCAENLNQHAKCLDREITYLYPNCIGYRYELCIEIK